MTSTGRLNAERLRLENQRVGKEDWHLWGPYLSERAWGTVREDYSEQGDAWGHFSHDQARSRAYRWSEDGLGGISDKEQRLCFALALWNGRDPILKERAFGLTGVQGNRGEDVKEYYFYLDATPSHSWLRYLYKYPQSAFPYGPLVEENARRSRLDPPFNLLDTGAFGENRYFDVDIVYAKADPSEIHIRIIATNLGPEAAELHLLPTLWFRNTWSWADGAEKPLVRAIDPPAGAAWAVEASHPEAGGHWLYGRQAAQRLFTENENNAERLWGLRNGNPYVKDAFHRHVINGTANAVNPALTGTKFAGWHSFMLAPSEQTRLDLVLSGTPLAAPFERNDTVLAMREEEASKFYRDLFPDGGPEDQRIFRQALAGMVWSKQFFHYDVERWLSGDTLAPPPARRRGRNAMWTEQQPIIALTRRINRLLIDERK